MSDDIIIAVIATAPPTIVAVAGLVTTIQNKRQLKGNGRGTHTQMLETVDDKLDTISTQMAEHVAEDRRMFDQVFQTIGMFSEEVESLARIISNDSGDRNGSVQHAEK